MIKAFENLSDAGVAATLTQPVTYTVQDNINAVAHNIHTKITSLEPYQNGLDRQRGHFFTSHVKDFADYVKRVGNSESTEIFINPEQIGAKAVLNYNEQGFAMGRCDFTANISAQKTPVYQMLTDNNGRTHCHREFIEMVVDYAPELTAYNAKGEEVEISHAINALRNIDITASVNANQQIQDLSESRSKLEQVSAKTKDENMPVRFGLFDACYESLPPTTVNLRMSITTDGNKPYFKISIEQHALLERNRLEEFTSIIKEELGVQFNVSIGTFQATNQ